MQKYRFVFWVVFVLVLGLCAMLLASDKTAGLNGDLPLQQKLNLQKISRLLPKEARTSLPLDLQLSQKVQQSDKAVAGTGAIRGCVTQFDGGAAIEGVMVWADLQDCPSYFALATTGSDGYYTITGLPAGKYLVNTMNDSDFVDLYWDNNYSWETKDTVPVISNDTTEDVDFSLKEGGKITGTVALPGAFYVSGLIFAIDTTHRDSYYSNVFGVGSPTTYFAKRLPTGTYKLITMNMRGYDVLMEHPTSYVDVYYDGKSSWATADPVSVTLGSTTSDKNFDLDSGGVIQGNISTAKGHLEDIYVWGFYAPNLEWFSSASTDSDGNYTLMGLRSGYWKIVAEGDTFYASEWYDNKNTWSNADSILVTAPNTYSGKDFPLETGGSISGLVHDLVGNPLSGCDVTAYESSFLMWGFVAKSETSSATGSYKITGLRTGDYKVEASTDCGDPQWYDHVSTWELATPVHVEMPADHPGIDFNVSTAVEDEDEMTQRPSEFELYQNYPNPFNPGT
ncbi:MAG: carboxypeptidase-like regulatory domain-containing protein, partial [candidate division Zixibacteria bacterium]|nr:carboxypeptidase-like regulatory domain-containing protein [candidate division Zixibacteria bacterium]